MRTRSVFLIRHGPAADRSEYRSDAERPLTAEGVRKTGLCARGFAQIAQPTAILTSPLLRARQTAELFAGALDPAPKIHALDELAGIAGMSDLLRLLNDRPEDSLALVGHEPDMGQLISFLLTGRQTVQVDFKKSAAGRIDFADKIAAGEGSLIWFLPPKALIALAKG